ncbi:MAG: peptidase C26 [Thalassobius sp.]|nr:peptidase C26 [Thalassovita sp.]
MLKIGVSSCFMYPDIDRTVFGPKSLLYFEKDMANYLSRKDVLPILIPDLDDKSILEEFLKEMDGFVFQGGTDLSPTTYGEQPIGRWQGDRQRDIYELEILDFAIKNDKPVFAICRGLQLLNVYFGGSLYQDIETQFKTNVEHRNAKNYDTIAHEIIMPDDSYLNNIYPNSDKLFVNTIHHQAIKDLGNDLDILATSKEDHLVEAIMWNKSQSGKVLGVQWHPEFTHTLGGLIIDGNPLYDNFLSFCHDS